jgi:hypothetical protein
LILARVSPQASARQHRSSLHPSAAISALESLPNGARAFAIAYRPALLKHPTIEQIVTALVAIARSIAAFLYCERPLLSKKIGANQR